MDGYVRIGTQVDTKDFDAEIKYIESQLEEIEHKLKQADMSFEVGDTQKLEAQYSRLVKQLDRLQKKQADLNKTDLSGVQKSIENVGKSTSKVITKMGKWALGIFAIESAYGFVRRMMSSVAENNEQIKTDLDYIHYSISQAFVPTIEYIIDLVYNLLEIIASVVNALFGVNMFANASAEGFRKANKSAGELKKTLAGFDEMNVLNENGSVGVANAGYEPKVDFSKMVDGETAEDLKSWWETIFNFWEEDFANFDYSFAGNWELFLVGLITTFKGLWDTIKGVIEASWGIGQMVIGLLTGDEELMRKGWENTVKGFIDFLYGIGEILLGAISLVFGILKGLVLDIYDNVIKPICDFFYQLTQDIGEFFREVIEKIVGWWKSGWQQISDFFVGIYNGIVGFIDKMVGHWKTGIKIMGDFFTNIFKGIINFFVDAINFVIKGLNKINFNVPDWVPTIGGEKFGFNIPTIPKLAVGGIVNMPSRGVPVGGAIAGESGAEGVIPLTDTQAMETLGATIGKYINISATVPVYVGNRQIAREIKKINAKNDFATNE